MSVSGFVRGAWVILLLILITFPGARAQDYQITNYRVNDGLPTDIIKAVAQDSLGFFWIATDDGLVRFDGKTFVTYHQALKNQYAKDLLTTRSGRLLAIGDLDLIEIKNGIDTVIFTSLLRGSSNPSDTTIWYPKTLYEDHSGDLWIGEPQAVVRYAGGRMKRYDFGMENRSPVFIRSFECFENSRGDFFTVSYQGVVFRWNRETDSFQQLSLRLPAEVSHAYVSGDILWIATATGVYTLNIAGSEPADLVNRLPQVLNASHIQRLNASTLVVSTYLKDVVLVDEPTATIRQRIDFDFRNVNECYISRDGDFWLSTLKGVYHLQTRMFSTVGAVGMFYFIESVIYDSLADQVYFCWKEGVGKVRQKGADPLDVFFRRQGSYFQCMAYNKQGLWVSDRHYLLLFRDGKLVKEWDFSGTGRFIVALQAGKEGDVWLSQASNSNLLHITQDYLVDFFPLAIPPKSNANAIQLGRTGMFAANNGNYGYLQFKPHGGQLFKGASHPLTFDIRQELEISDFFVGKDAIWMATNEGLLRYTGKGIERMPMGEFTRTAVKGVEYFSDRELIFTNSHGLFLYNTETGDHWLYNENVGLPSNTVTNRGIAVDAQRRIWVGTSSGLAVSVPFTSTLGSTPKPYCVGLTINGQASRFSNGITIDHDGFASVHMASITFPADNLVYQYRIEGRDSIWHLARGGVIELLKLGPGDHQLQIRARKNGGYQWSEVTTMPVHVRKAIWQQFWFIAFCLMVVVVIAYVTYRLTSMLDEARKRKLRHVIDLRTQELMQTNKELIQRNQELDRFVYSASHDLSSPLKSVLGLIEVTRFQPLSPQVQNYIDLMERSVNRLESFIGDVINYSRNTRLPAKIESFDFREMVHSVLDNHQFNPGFNEIRFDIVDNTSGENRTDVLRFRMVLNNLISNAIKFKREKPVESFVRAQLDLTGEMYVLTVEDNGSGIAEKHLPRIFEMFYRATSAAPGSGLGLYILKEAVGKMKGSVEVHSVHGEGTTFTIRFPRVME